MLEEEKALFLPFSSLAFAAPSSLQIIAAMIWDLCVHRYAASIG
jgi:hypothetical protein